MSRRGAARSDGVLVVMLARPGVAASVAMRVSRLPLLRRRMSIDDRSAALEAWCTDAKPLVGTVRLRSGLAGVSALSVLADGAVLWAAASAARVHLPFDVILLATTVGVLAGLVPFLPGGIGVVDAAVPALLHRYGIVWIAVNVGLGGVGHEFDKFPFGLLTMIVSLEAIFLATFVMISQNRQTARGDLRSQLDSENNIRGEIWSIHIGEALGLDVDHVEQVVRRALDGAQHALRNAPTTPATEAPAAGPPVPAG